MDQQTNTESILIVDDSAGIRDVLGMKLEREGYGVVIARSAEGAAKLLETEGFGLILLDIRLPDGSGLDLLKQLRQRHSLLDTPIIMISGLDQTGDVVAALREVRTITSRSRSILPSRSRAYARSSPSGG